jgi:hypothetical protein
MPPTRRTLQTSDTPCISGRANQSFPEYVSTGIQNDARVTTSGPGAYGPGFIYLWLQTVWSPPSGLVSQGLVYMRFGVFAGAEVQTPLVDGELYVCPHLEPFCLVSTHMFDIQALDEDNMESLVKGERVTVSICVCVLVCIHVCEAERGTVSIFPYIFVCMHARIRSTYQYIYIYIYIYICMCMHARICSIDLYISMRIGHGHGHE